jgi:cytidylate kinase
VEQLIISIGREFGTAGHEIAEKLAEHYGLPLYDQNLLDEIAEKRNVDSKKLKEFDEKQTVALYRTVKGMSSSPSENVAQMQFDYLREKAKSGESFVVVGRCSEEVLKDYKCMIPIFINGDMDCKVARIVKKYGLTDDEAREYIKKMDRKRKYYHNSHCDTKWGDSRNYELTINSSRLGIVDSVKMLIWYIDTRRA